MIAIALFSLLAMITQVRSDPESIISSRQVPSLPTIEGCGNKKVASLMISDAPLTNNQTFEDILKTLDTNSVKATFFMNPGAWNDFHDGSDLATRCERVRRLVDSGHEVQSHGWAIFDTANVGPTELVKELDQFSTWVQSCGAPAPNKFKVTFSSLSLSKAKILVSKGYTPVFETLSGNELLDSRSITNLMPKLSSVGFGKGSIVFGIKPNQAFSAEAFDILIQTMKKENYEFVTSSSCYDNCDTKDIMGICRTLTAPSNAQINLWDSEIFRQDMHSNRCGTTWTEAKDSCTASCTKDVDCSQGESCFRFLSVRPCLFP